MANLVPCMEFNFRYCKYCFVAVFKQNIYFVAHQHLIGCPVFHRRKLFFEVNGGCRSTESKTEKHIYTICEQRSANESKSKSNRIYAGLPSTVGSESDCESRGRWLEPQSGHILSLRFIHGKNSTTILTLPLIHRRNNGH